ncbi:Hypothetical protein, putative [Bodo saltans]|uniref:Uncharacterized protein n=1 Tax=Bodo saltans TaxID=75058 RepID=A0A0S4ISP8_BODSA|nr:Hypothetical protein, putative [Bodo saltans]|eukprot:CUG06113.1 Hypothetical protein, putative [Bodo saltans]
MGQKESTPTVKAAPTGKIAQRKAAEADQRKHEREEKKREKENSKKLASEVVAAQRAERDAARTSKATASAQTRLDTPAAAPAIKKTSKRSDDELPPEVAAMLLPIEGDSGGDCEQLSMMMASAMLAAQAALLDDEIDDDEGDHLQMETTGPDERKVKNNADEENVSLHSSDYRDDDLMGQLAELEAEAESSRNEKIAQLEVSIAALKKEALTLMRSGDKPAALQQLKKAKELEKELGELSANA